ncbi:hypothetical protein [Ponticaulis sp.]|uniref:hypothetical protein n=1 Tax=Ponticaulis sp. TaxID=2020902 RepID=UPI000B67296A|nr:hypothetical protein [Ponticaulis sp.]MAI91566.1 hypothetical protein [Ponticaulis sp.]OUX97521.1 MAG: hypothetical protein CBB65_14085 [Hyphomonadaceae bacterium TMED5]|tara:strand:+ start:23896 stop:24588 length:693 start_codon:yes stop_codon:yes gene_type:complete
MTGKQFKFAFPTPILPLEALFPDAQGKSALGILRRWKEWPKWYVGLTGPDRSGVSSVLRSWSDEVGGEYLTPQDWQKLDAKDLAELLQSPLALDDCHLVENSSNLLTVINLAVEAETTLLLGGHGSPQDWHASPPDLVSRLSAMTTIVLPGLDDEMFLRRLRAACLRRYIKLPEETLAFLEPRLERSYQWIEAFATALDQAMTDTGRPPTIPLARDVLAALTEDLDTDEE